MNPPWSSGCSPSSGMAQRLGRRSGLPSACIPRRRPQSGLPGQAGTLLSEYGPGGAVYDAGADGELPFTVTAERTSVKVSIAVEYHLTDPQ